MKKNNNITCRIFFVIGLLILSHPALAEQVKPKFSAVICLEPVSGREMILNSPDAACPSDYEYFRLFKLVKMPGLPPQHQKEKEAPDAASGQK